MKTNTLLFLMILIGSMLFANAEAQNKKDYFTGKWTVIAKNLPNGNETASLDILRKDGKLEGSIKRQNGEVIKISQLVEKNETITGSFYAEGYDMELFIQKKDADNITGSIMGTYSLEGVRNLPKKKK